MSSERDHQVAGEDAAALSTKGQRRLSLLREVAQATIGLAVCFTALIVAATLVLRGGADQAAFTPLWNGFFLIVGFYFSRPTRRDDMGAVEPR